MPVREQRPAGEAAVQRAAFPGESGWASHAGHPPALPYAPAGPPGLAAGAPRDRRALRPLLLPTMGGVPRGSLLLLVARARRRGGLAGGGVSARREIGGVRATGKGTELPCCRGSAPPWAAGWVAGWDVDRGGRRSACHGFYRHARAHAGHGRCGARDEGVATQCGLAAGGAPDESPPRCPAPAGPLAHRRCGRGRRAMARAA